ncbi:hypothetical protein LINPERHAP1_LOCUS3940 [Linum perenne]
MLVAKEVVQSQRVRQGRFLFLEENLTSPRSP